MRARLQTTVALRWFLHCGACAQLLGNFWLLRLGDIYSCYSDMDASHANALHFTPADKRILRRLVAAASCPRFAPQRLAVELELPEATLRRQVRLPLSACAHVIWPTLDSNQYRLLLVRRACTQSGLCGMQSHVQIF